MEDLPKLQKSLRDRGTKLTIRHAVRYLLQEPAYPLISRLLSPKTHEKIKAAPVVGYWPDLQNPRSFNEKIIKRKLSGDQIKEFSEISDKYAVRDYVYQEIKEEILPDLYYLGNDSDQIPFEEFPSKFVIKATHGSGMTAVVETKQNTNLDHLRSRCDKWLNRTYGHKSREYWYPEIQPQIIVEEYIEDPNYKIPPDFKFYVFSGCVEFIHVDFNRFSGNRSRRFFDKRWNPYDFKLDFPLGPKIDRPSRLDEMVRIAETLGEGFEFIRVDLYHTSDNQIYFGEMTLAPGAGMERFSPVKWDFRLGEYW